MLDTMLEPRSVLVTHAPDANSHEVFGVSGILLTPNWVLTHGSLLGSSFYEASDHLVRDFLVDVQGELERDLLPVPEAAAKSMKLKLQYSLDSDGMSQRKIIEEKKCSMRVAWRCPLLRRTFNNLLFSWSFGRVAKYDKSLLPIFLLLRVDDNLTSGDLVAEARQVLSKFYADHLELSDPRPRRGTPVELESTPFGSLAFLDSLSRGVVSNVLGDADCVILSDATAVPGCEGAPLFLVEQKDETSRRRIRGLALAPLSWCNGERVDYTFAANLRICLRKILEGSVSPGLEIAISRSVLLPDSLDKSIVLVKSSFNWGTGIIVDASIGILITCSHVVHEVPGSRVKVRLSNDVDAIARLIYKTRDGQPYDVAVLKLEREHKGLKALPIASRLPDRGTSVMTVGFSFWQSALASCSRGVISRKTSCMLQTTCCVQSGSSGGPVVDCGTGQMLGLVVSNVASSSSGDENGTLYPKFNMAVPASILRRPLMEYIRTGDVQCLESLTSYDPMVQETWNFYLTPQSKM